MAVVFDGEGKKKVHYGPCLQLDLPPTGRAAGWEREIAPSVMLEVDVCPTFLSDDTHTPGVPPRFTQPSVGRHVREVKHYRDASYGSHFGLYGGVNLLPVFGERMRTVPTVPRTHHHFGTGANGGKASCEAVALHPTIRALKVSADRANMVPTPSRASAIMQKHAMPAKLYPQEREAVFPFPSDPAGTRCPAVPPPVRAQPPQPPVPPQLPRHSEGPTSPPPEPLPLGNPNDYGYCKLLEDSGPSRMRGHLEVDQSEFYIPGQIGDVTRSEADAAKSPAPEPPEQEPAEVKARRPLYERRVIPYRPPHEFYQLDPWIGQDKEKLQRVGVMFKSDICNAHYSQYPPGPQPGIIEMRCDYPDLSLSVL